MRSLLRVLALPLVLLATSSASASLRCSCARAVFFGVVAGTDMTLPAESEGLRLVSRVDPRAVLGQAVKIRQLGSGADLALTLSQPDSVRFPNDWVVRPEGGFEQGARYLVQTGIMTSRRSGGLSDPPRVLRPMIVTVGESPRPALEGLALELSDPVIQNVVVSSSGGLCSEAARSVARRVAIRFPGDLGRYRHSLQYETLINGEPFAVRRSLCDTPIAGITRGPAGTDVAFAHCDGRASLVREGQHRISMRVWDFRTGEETTTPEVDLELVCSDELPEVTAPVHPAVYGEAGNSARTLLGDGRETWISTPNAGLHNQVGASLIRVTSEDGLPSDEIIDLMYDSEGRLWAAGRGGWAVQGSPRVDWEPSATLGGLSPSVVSHISEAPDGAIWFSSDVGAARLSEGSWEIFTSEQGLPSDVVLATLTNDSGQTWFACPNGLARTTDEGGVEVIFDNLSINSLLETPEGELLVGTSDGLRTWDGAEWSSSLEGSAARALLVSPDETVWVASAAAGLVRSSPGGWQPAELPVEYRGTEILDADDIPNWILLATSRGAARLYWAGAPELQDTLGVATAVLREILPDASVADSVVATLGADVAQFCLVDGRMQGGLPSAAPLRNRELTRVIADHIERVTGKQHVGSCSAPGSGEFMSSSGEPAMAFSIALSFNSLSSASVGLTMRRALPGIAARSWSCVYQRGADGSWQNASEQGCRRFGGWEDR